MMAKINTKTKDGKSESETKNNGKKTRTVRNFPIYSIEDALRLPQKIQDEKAGKPFRRLLLAEALGIKPASTNFRDLISSCNKYGLIQGSESSTEISLTDIGEQATQTGEPTNRLAAIRSAIIQPPVFNQFYTAYTEHKLPSSEMMVKLLIAEYNVPGQYADECAKLIIENGRFAEIIRDIGGSPHVLLDAEISTSYLDVVGNNGSDDGVSEELVETRPITDLVELSTTVPSETARPRAIFIGHGKKKGPLEKLQKFLTSFQIPHKLAVDEPNLGRPIPQKVKETMLQCGSAILIFTCDEKFFDGEGNEIWRPSENVVHELGAASFAYEDRVVIFKEKGISFPSNFQSMGYIEFEENQIDAKTTDLLKELIGFGLVKVTTA